jgi:hypothetical protein
MIFDHGAVGERHVVLYSHLVANGMIYAGARAGAESCISIER